MTQFNNLPRNSPSNAKRWVGMDSEPSFSSVSYTHLTLPTIA